MENKRSLVVILCIFFNMFLLDYYSVAQVENVPVSHPVYDFLLRAETKGYLPHFSLSQIPWQRKTIISALELIEKNNNLLTSAEKNTLSKYEQEFGLKKYSNSAVVFYSDSDSIQVLSSKIFSDCEKYIYRSSSDSSTTNNNKKNSSIIEPLASIEVLSNFKKNALLIGTLGARIFGTFTGNFGYYLQVTNSAMLSGNDSLALIDQKYFINNKFRKDLSGNNDADMTESHVAFQSDWFYASIGRETRLEGAGLIQRIFINNLSPAFDALTLAAKFSNFEYKFSHNSLINFPVGVDFSHDTYIPPKYVAMHTFSLRPSWGELGFYESVIYSRELDLAYFNPLSFLKSLEHAQHNRDNCGMGITATVRPIKHLQIKTSWFLDDIQFSKIGTGYWGNKTAWNIAGLTSIINNLDCGIEYSRVEPYTYTHFNSQNSNTNDSILFSSMLLPNSDRWSLVFQYWFGHRYPIKLSMNYTRHGANIYDSDNNLIFNAGADPLQSIRWAEDSDTIEFLSGDLHKIFSVELSVGLEIIRGFNLYLTYYYQKNNNSNILNSNNSYSKFNSFYTNINNNYIRLLFRFSDF